MNEPRRRGPIARIAIGMWDAVNFTRRLVFNLLFLLLLAIVLVAMFGGGKLAPLSDRTTLVIAPQGRLVEQFSCDPLSRAFARATNGDDADRAARDQLAARVQGVVFGQQYLMLDYDCPRTVLDRATAITPGLESPTIAPLADADWVAVRALVPRRDVNAIMDELAAIGAKAILASDIRFCRF